VSTGKHSYAASPDAAKSGRGRRFALLAARFNAHVTDQLLQRARATLLEHDVTDSDAEVFRVPGAWELPQAAIKVAGTGRFHAVVALGCVIRGETPHFDFIAGEAARGLGEASYRSGVPVIFGVLTTETEQQALERADPKGGDKGREAALAALEMADLFQRLGTSGD
jgi:6,7-dimethyl-8-ribityllumazine synthase